MLQTNNRNPARVAGRHGPPPHAGPSNTTLSRRLTLSSVTTKGTFITSAHGFQHCGDVMNLVAALHCSPGKNEGSNPTRAGFVARV